MNSNEKHGEAVHHHRHHSHSHEHKSDESEVFKQKSFLSIKRRKQIGKVLYAILSIIALIIVIACIASSFIS